MPDLVLDEVDDFFERVLVLLTLVDDVLAFCLLAGIVFSYDNIGNTAWVFNHAYGITETTWQYNTEKTQKDY